MEIERLFIYPVKSLLPVEVTYAEVTREGFRFDRQYILIKTPESTATRYAEHLTIKRLFTLALFQPSIDDDWSMLTIKHTRAHPESCVTIPLTPSPVFCIESKSYDVSISGSNGVGIDMGEIPARFFSQHLGQDVRLLFIGGDGGRRIPASSGFQNLHVGLIPRLRFADVAPFLVTSSASELEARSRLPLQYQSEDIIARFRPNIHLRVAENVPPFDEDNWLELTVLNTSGKENKAAIYCISHTARCLSLNADLQTGKMVSREQQLFGLLARDRRIMSTSPNKPVFGEYAYITPIGTVLRLGDKVIVSRRH